MSKNKEFNLFQSRGILLLAILFIFILILTFFFGDRGILEVIKMKREIRRLNSVTRAQEAERNTLQVEVNQLRNYPQAVEKKAREKLWLMKKNEKLIIVENKKKERNRE